MSFRASTPVKQDRAATPSGQPHQLPQHHLQHCHCMRNPHRQLCYRRRPQYPRQARLCHPILHRLWLRHRMHDTGIVVSNASAIGSSIGPSSVNGFVVGSFIDFEVDEIPHRTRHRRQFCRLRRQPRLRLRRWYHLQNCLLLHLRRLQQRQYRLLRQLSQLRNARRSRHQLLLRKVCRYIRLPVCRCINLYGLGRECVVSCM